MIDLEILKYLHKYYNTDKILIDIGKEDFNLYKIIEEIDKSILNYFKGG